MTTTVTKTIRASGGDYSLLSSWEATIPADLVAVDEKWKAEVYNDWPAGLVDAVTITSVTADATRNIIIEPAEGHGHDGTPGSGFYINPTSTPWTTIDVYCAFTVIRAIEIRNSKVSTSAVGVKLRNNDIVLENCILSHNATTGHGVDVVNSETGRIVSNNYFYNFSTGIYAPRQITAFNNVIANCTAYGFRDTTPAYDKNIHNNICYNNAIDFEYGTETGDNVHTNNASSDLTATGMGSITGITSAEFVDAANHNFTIVGASQFKNAGANPVLLGVSTPNKTDIFGAKLPNAGIWDIGYNYTSPTDVKYAIRTAAAWAAMTAGEQAEYAGTFELISGWASIIPADLQTPDEKWTAECFNDWPSGLNDIIDIPAKTTDDACNVVITSPVGQRHNGTPRSGFHIAAGSWSNNMLGLNSEHTVVEYLDLYRNTGNKQLISAIDGCIVRNCIIDQLTKNNNGLALTTIGQTYTPTAINNIIINATSGIYFGYWPTTMIGNTCVGCDTGINGAASSNEHVLTNNVTHNCTTSYTITAVTTDSGNNAASDATTNTPPGINPLLLDVVDSDFVDAANDDYHLSASSQLIGQGANLYNLFQTDIDGDDMPSIGAWDIGADYYVASGATIYTFDSISTLSISGSLVYSTTKIVDSLSSLIVGGTADVVYTPAGNNSYTFDSISALSIGGAAEYSKTNAIDSVSALNIGGALDYTTTKIINSVSALTIGGAADVTLIPVGTNIYAFDSVSSLSIGGDAGVAVSRSLDSIAALSIGGALDYSTAYNFESVSALNVGGTADGFLVPSGANIYSFTSTASLSVGGSAQVSQTRSIESISNLSISGAAEYSKTTTTSSISTLNIGGIADVIHIPASITNVYTFGSVSSLVISGAAALTITAVRDSVSSLFVGGTADIWSTNGPGYTITTRNIHELRKKYKTYTLR